MFLKNRRRKQTDTTRRRTRSPQPADERRRQPVDGVIAHAVAWGAPVDILYTSADSDEAAH